MLTEAQGLPVGVAVNGSNMQEVRQLRAMLDAVLDAVPVLPSPAEGDFAPGFCRARIERAQAVASFSRYGNPYDHARAEAG